ncbi:MAG: transporter [Bacteroidales bacterium]|nr:transporter [Bacteroidales bacterium]
MQFLQFLKNNALPLAILLGCVFWQWTHLLSWILPYNLFIMLFLSFSRVSVSELKFKKVHLLLLLVLIIGGLGSYLIISPFNKILAESVMVVVMCPTATAAVVVTTKLGGSAPNVVSFTLLVNLVMALLIPTVFPLIENNDKSFIDGFLAILQKVFPMLVCPMVLSELLRKITPKFHSNIQKISSLSFYLWAFSIIVLMGRTTKDILDKPENVYIDILMAISSLIVCILLYIIGKKIGTKFDDRVSCGQNVGQKNTIFAIWVAQTYLNPLSALGSSFYIVWQNLFNSWQLQKKRKHEEKKSND